MKYSKLNKLIGQKNTGIHCKTREQAIELDNVLIQLGGRSLMPEAFDNYGINTIFYLEDVKTGYNCYGSLDKAKGRKETILTIEDIIQPEIENSYEIF